MFNFYVGLITWKEHLKISKKASLRVPSFKIARILFCKSGILADVCMKTGKTCPFLYKCQYIKISELYLRLYLRYFKIQDFQILYFH